MGVEVTVSLDLTLSPDAPADVVRILEHIAGLSIHEGLPERLSRTSPHFQQLMKTRNGLAALIPMEDSLPRFETTTRGLRFRLQGWSRNAGEEYIHFGNWVIPYLIPQGEPWMTVIWDFLDRAEFYTDDRYERSIFNLDTEKWEPVHGPEEDLTPGEIDWEVDPTTLSPDERTNRAVHMLCWLLDNGHEEKVSALLLEHDPCT